MPAAKPAHSTPLTSARRRARTRRELWSALLLLPLLWPLCSMLGRLRASRQATALPLPADLPQGLSVAGAAIVQHHADGRVQAWEARCTHLGCRLDRVVHGVVVCPCHGSRFDADGRVLNGPATRALQPLRVTADAQTGGWTVEST